MTENKKILFFSPYSSWLIHSQVDAIMAKALEMRGCEVLIILCDGIYKDCYITRELSNEQALNICQSCSQIGQDFFESFGLTYLQLRDFIAPDDYALANEWIKTINSDDYANATYQELPIGRWIISSIYTYFRISPNQLSRSDVRRTNRQYLIDGFVTYKAVSRLLDNYLPTNLFLFNGRIAPYRIAFEAARQRQIDTITHERGFIDDSFSFYDNCSALNTKPSLDCVTAWENIALNQSELQQVKQYFTNRESGLNLNWPAFYDFKTNYAEVRQKLRIPVNAKIFTVFTSSEDELTAYEDYAGITGQLDIIDSLINIFQDRDEYLVIRHHPFIGGDKLSPPNNDFLSRAYRQALSAPKNVRIVMPSEQLTSYALLWHTEAAIAFFSTVSIEAAVRGVPTAIFNLSPYHKALKFFLQNNNLSLDNLKNLVDNLLNKSACNTVEDLRKLYRFTHAYFFRFSNKFSSFGIKNSHYHDLRLQSVEELKPGNDPALDRICNRISNGSFLYDVSGRDDKNRSPVEEENFLQQELLEVREYSQKVKAQALIQNISFPHAPLGVIYLKYKGEQNDSKLLQAWIEQSRHENIILHSCSNLEREDYQDIIESIINIIEGSQQEYILVTNSQFQYDESFISSALDILLNDENQQTVGVRFGAWLSLPDDGIQQQIFTSQVPVLSYEQAVEIFPHIREPQTLLSFIIIRSHSLVGILNSIKQMPTVSQSAKSLFTLLNEAGIYKIQMPMLVVHESDNSELLSSQVLICVTDYQNESANEAALANLRQVRKQIADLWLKMSTDQLQSAYSGDIGKAHQILLNSDIKNEALTDIEKTFVNNVSEQIAIGFEHPKAMQYLLVAMLYRRAHQLPLKHECEHIPQWLVDNYFKFIFQPPNLFQEIGEVDSYYRYLQGWVDYLHSNIFRNPDSELWHNISLLFTKSANFLCLYFTSGNLRDIYSKRADIMEFALQNCGAEIDYIFPDKPLYQAKIRLGVLNAHFTPQTETFHTIPAFEHLDRNLFEIILYSINLTGHQLEQYCQTCADQFVQLPQDLDSQVQMIRTDELDILLIGTNVSAVTHPITLLALHRLARLQATFGSSPATSGMRNIDYFISGSLSEPMQGGQEHYREKLVTLDGPGYCFNYTIEPETLSIKPDRKSWGIADESVVFISGANFFKIIPELRETWAKILAAVPNSILVLYPFAPSWSNYYPAKPFLQQMYAVLAKYGVDNSRIVVLSALPSRADVKECLKLGDIYLDSYRHSGGHSLVDALQVSLPTVVLEGDSLRSRHAAAYLRELQIPDLITDNEADYIKLSILLGTNPEWRWQKSEQIRQKMQANPRFLNSHDYSAQVSTLFQELFQNHQAIAFADKLRLRSFNLIIFPDWSQSEDVIYQDIASVISNLVHHTDKNQMTLLINIGNVSEDDANLFLSDIVMNLLLDEELDVAGGPEISLVGQLADIQWEALLPRIHTRIVLEHEDKQALVAVKAENLLSCDLDSFITSHS